MERYKIFLVEDDPVISKAVADRLTMWGYQVKTVENFAKVLEEFLSFEPQLVLLDIGLPHQSGYFWCREIRKHSKIPIVFLSSASDNLDVITAMDLGGDDFISKPFDLSVLTAKIHAVLRRAYSFQGTTSLVERQGVVLDLAASSLSCSGGRLELTKNELRILRVLMENAGHPVSRSELMKRLWESDSFIDGNTLSVNMTRLRKRLETVGLSAFVTTKKGQGYLVL